jgi:16S rRNA (uracil1498-N3)-methyltransferase
MAERFYLNCPLALGPVVAEGPEAQHLSAVCRVRPGDAVRLFNGDGHEYPAEVVEARRRSVLLRVLGRESPRRELDFHLEVAAPVPKGDRAQFLVEKLTELGVTRYVPLQTRRSVVHPREAKLDKLQRYVIEASKQCGRNVLLEVAPLAEWDAYMARRDLPRARLMGHPGGATPSWPAGADVAVAVGPEGGFTDEEVEAARAAGWCAVDLGPRILRIETAAVALSACCTHPWATRSPAMP